MTIAVQAVNEVREIALEQLNASLKNPRRTMDEAGLRELAASIREHGINVPLLVRPIDLDCMTGEPLPGEARVGDAFEIVCGHRRSEAATIAGLTSVPCIVRAMDDATAAELALVDNLQRVDVPAIEEAQAFAELLARLGSLQAVAAKVGKDQAYVAKRLRLCSLTVWAQDALRQKLITVDHALLLARLGEREQNEALKWTLDTQAGVKKPVDQVIKERLGSIVEREKRRKESGGIWSAWEPESVQRLKEHIERTAGRKLSRAPWPLDDESLAPTAEACASCPNNTKANAPLFSDLAIEDATCADGNCYEAKRAAFVSIKLREAGNAPFRKPPQYVPQLSWKYSTVKPATCFNDVDAPGVMSTTANPAKVLRQGQWVEAKKGSCPNVRPGITVDWSDDGDRGYMGDRKAKLRKPGELLQVCIAAGCKVHRKEWEKPKSDNNTRREDPAEAAKRKEEEAHIVKIEGEIRETVLRAILAKIDAAKAVRIVAEAYSEAKAWTRTLLTWFPQMAPEQVDAFVLFCCSISRDLRPNGYWMMQQGGVANDRKDLWGAAKAAGIDANAVAAKYFHDAGSIAPWSDRLYPKGIAWPKDKAKATAEKPAKKATAKPAAAKPTKKAILSPEARKRIAAAQKKRWAAAKKGGGKAS